MSNLKDRLCNGGTSTLHSQRFTENVSTKNAHTIAEYILAMNTENNLSDNYRATIIQLLSTLSKFHKNKNFPS